MWARIVSAIVGVWLVASPGVLGYGGRAAVNDRIVGPVIAAIAIVAAAGVTRELRWAELPLGLWLLIAPWTLGYHNPVLAAQSMIAGFVLLALVPFRGRVRASYGGGWRVLWSDHGDT
ncbi:MAG TPA: SPW repeat protein [Gemmatimonadaceae bacterium]|nr:SPW repeat protein [Gemmatimonadaceae bacterium]